MPPSQRFASRVLTDQRPKVASLYASAQGMSRVQRDKKTPKINARDWQNRAWDFFDEVGEYRYAVSWVGNLLSKATLHVTKNGEPVETGPAADAMAGLFGGPAGHPEMLRQLGVNFTVSGEGFLIGEDGGEADEDRWYVAPAGALTGHAGRWRLGEMPLTNPLIIRQWRPHPRHYTEPDSPSRPVLPILSEIVGLTKHVSAQIDSRLAGAGMLLLPQEISFQSATATTKDGEDGEQVSQEPGLDTFLQNLIAAMTTAIVDRDDASALVPLLVQAPGEYLDKIKHLTFWSGLDEKAIELRSEAIRRLALGMDMPPEALLGTADMNHWGAWQMEEAAIKSHTEPLLQVITGSLTSGFLVPYLEAEGVEDARDFQVVADTSGMRLRPNRSKEAIELYDRAELSGKAVRRENGFDESDAMDDVERAKWLTKKVAGGSTTPELVEAALKAMGTDIVAAPAADSEEGQEERPTPSLREHPRRQEPDTIDEAAVAAAEVVVLRALERAGNRLKSKFALSVPGAPASELYFAAPPLSKTDVDDLLVDAWSMLDRLPHSIPEGALDAYARMLLTERREHKSDAFATYLRGYSRLHAVVA